MPSPQTLQRNSWPITISLLTAAIAYTFCVFWPNRSFIQDIKREIGEKKSFLDASHLSLEQLIKTQRRIVETEDYLKQWSSNISTLENLPALYGKIHAFGKEAGITSTRFESQPRSALNCFERTPILLECVGHFKETYEFLRRLEDLSPGVCIDSIKIDKASDDAGTIAAEIKLIVLTDKYDFQNNLDGR